MASQHLPSVLIIGAGTAGLSAAAELHRKGFTRVKVYEARNRIGGRIHSVPQHSAGGDGDTIIEMGAQWIHGQVGNPVFDICKREGLLDTTEMPSNLFLRRECFPSLSESESKIVQLVYESIDKATDKCSALSSRNFRLKSVPVANSLHEFLENRLKKELFDKQEDPETKKVLSAAFDWAVRLQNEINGGATTEVSANYLGEYEYYEGDPLTTLGPKGYRGFLDVLLKDIPKEWIFTDVEVTNINYSKLPLKVESSRGSEDYDFVICSIPLGVLKERKAQLFTPQLSARKAQTIDSLGFGVCDKIYLFFDESDVFWKNGDVFNVLWKNEVSAPSWFHKINRINAVPHSRTHWCVGWPPKQR